MPVLDAKALEIDSKGAAFLLSVLRPASPGSTNQPKEVTPLRIPPQNVRMYFRFTRRLKLLLPNLA
jgi:hypothetical protein